jgi:hypothetical protein
MLPEVHERLSERLGDQYVSTDWNKPLDAVLSAESDVNQALSALEHLRDELEVYLPAESERSARTEQCTDLEDHLQGLVNELKNRRRIIGEPLSLDEFLDPEEERKVSGEYDFEGGDAEIVALVQNGGPDDDSDSDSDSDEESGEPQIPLKDMIEMCRALETASVGFSNTSGLEVVKVLRRFRGELQKASTKNAVQTSLDSFFQINT